MKQPPDSGAWVWVLDPRLPFTWHEIPENDLIEHELSANCICGPSHFPDRDGTTVIAHPSLDGREPS